MRRPADQASHWVMDRVVVDEKGHSEDVHGQIDGHDEQDAHGAVLIGGVEVVLRVDLDPLLFEHEVNFGVVSVAISVNHAVSEAPTDAWHLLHDLDYQILVVQR